MKKFVEKLVGVTLVGYIILVVVVFGWALLGSDDGSTENSSKNTSTNGTPTNTDTGTSTSSGYTKAEVANHNTSADCWTIFNNKVYNLTDYFGHHPAGNATLLKMCGVDSSNIYDSSHNHSLSADAIFESYYVGDVKN